MSITFGLAFYKAQDAAKPKLPVEGTVLLTICDRDQNDLLVKVARQFTMLGFKIMATEGTQKFLKAHAIDSEYVMKIHEGRPNVSDAIKNGEIHLVVNTPSGKLSAYDDSYIRKSAIKHKIPYITTLAAALATAEGITARHHGAPEVKSLQEYHADIIK